MEDRAWSVAPTTSAFFRASYALPFLLGLWLLQRGANRRPGVVLGTVAVGVADGELDLAVTWPAHGWLLVLASARRSSAGS